MRSQPNGVLNSGDRDLLEAARAVRARAYAPYSGFAVGAAVRTRSGAIFVGCNMENASYGIGLCAEAGALMAAVAQADFSVVAIAVVGGPLQPMAAAEAGVTTPCGRCRQLIYEAGCVAEEDVRVLSANADMSRVEESTIRQLLPGAFGPANLGRGAG
jgi:cytidine deaminase